MLKNFLKVLAAALMLVQGIYVQGTPAQKIKKSKVSYPQRELVWPKDKMPDAQPGQIIAALVDEETATLKRYRPKPDLHLVELEPANPEYKTQVIDLEQRPFSIQGIAVMIIRRLEN